MPQIASLPAPDAAGVGAPANDVNNAVALCIIHPLHLLPEGRRVKLLLRRTILGAPAMHVKQWVRNLIHLPRHEAKTIL